MTFAELTGKWPLHPESHNPESAIYIIPLDRKTIFVAPTETKHATLYALAGLPITEDRKLVRDAGEVIGRGGHLYIANHPRPETVSIAAFFEEYSEFEEMTAAFDEVRKLTGGIICQLSGRAVYVQLCNGEYYEVSF